MSMTMFIASPDSESRVMMMVECRTVAFEIPVSDAMSGKTFWIP